MISGSRPASSRILLRGVLPIVIGLVIGALAGALFASVAHKRYAATSRVLVTATGVDSSASTTTGGRTNGTINMDTEAQLVTSAAVIQAATVSYPQLTSETFDDLVRDIAIAVPPNSQILQITFTADSAAAAQSGANALASAYLDNREKTSQSLLTAQIQNAEQSKAAAEKQLQLDSAKYAALPSKDKGRALLQITISLAKGQITDYNQELADLGTIQVTPGSVLTAASRPTAPTSPSRLIAVASGAAVGLVLGLLAAWLLFRFRRRVRDADDVTHVVDVPCLAVLRSGDAMARRDALRRLTLVTTSTVPDARCLLVTSPLRASSAGAVAAAMGDALRRSGVPAALLRIGAGSSQRVTGVRAPGVALTTLPSAEAASSRPGEKLPAALTRLRDGRDVLVVDAAGAAETADPLAVGAAADAVLLVVDAGSRTRHLRTAVAALDAVGAPLLGVVVVGRGALAVERDERRPADTLDDLLADSAADRSADAFADEPADGSAEGSADDTDDAPVDVAHADELADPAPDHLPAEVAEATSEPLSADEPESTEHPAEAITAMADGTDDQPAGAETAVAEEEVAETAVAEDETAAARALARAFGTADSSETGPSTAVRAGKTGSGRSGGTRTTRTTRTSSKATTPAAARSGAPTDHDAQTTNRKGGGSEGASSTESTAGTAGTNGTAAPTTQRTRTRSTGAGTSRARSR